MYLRETNARPSETLEARKAPWYVVLCHLLKTNKQTNKQTNKTKHLNYENYDLENKNNCDASGRLSLGIKVWENVRTRI